VTPTAAAAADVAEPAAVGDLIDRNAIVVVPPPPASTSPAQRHGVFDQQPQREQEDAVRRRAAEVGRSLLGRGWAWARIAEFIRVAGRTLRHWCRRLLDRLRPACSLGRPVIRSSRAARNDVIHLLDELGPQVGLPTLRACFPDMSRAELEDLLIRYRRVWRERNRRPLRVLTWPVPGRVWAIDFAEPPAPVDGRFDYLLAVRDLASGMPLLWRPVAAATAAQAAAGLAGLFAEHGPPLVLKSDNGSHFTGGAVPRLLAAHRVEHLLSPPHWPQYNGSIEAGIGALKDRTDARAARAGHAGRWTWDDPAGALDEAAHLAQPQGPTGPSPAARWAARTPIAADERAAFTAVVARQIACGEVANGVWSERAVARTAIRHALEECGYLQYRRRSILPPITGRKVASNT
jgi:transposase InsO family protein